MTKNIVAQTNFDLLKNAPRKEKSLLNSKSIESNRKDKFQQMHVFSTNDVTKDTTSSKSKTPELPIVREEFQGATALFTECEIEVSIFICESLS